MILSHCKPVLYILCIVSVHRCCTANNGQLFAVVFMLIGFIIFGAELQGDPHWSYAFCVIGAILCFVASILGIVQIKKSNVA